MISANPIYFIRVIYTYVSIVHVILTSLRLLFHCICEDEYDQVFLLFLSWSEVNGRKAQTKYTLKSRFTIFHNFFFLWGIRTNKDACGFGKRFYFSLIINLTAGDISNNWSPTKMQKCASLLFVYFYRVKSWTKLEEYDVVSQTCAE